MFFRSVCERMWPNTKKPKGENPMVVRLGRRYKRKDNGQWDLFSFTVPVEDMRIFTDQAAVLMGEFAKRFPNYNLERKIDE